MHRLIPKPTAIRSLVLQNWKAGITVALISVPLSIALSIASGAGPIPGLITGIWATLIASIFCSNNYNIIGAAGALTTILFASTLAAPLGLGAAVLPLIAITAGLVILGIWAAGIDRFLYYIPSSVMYGFAAGVAFLIAASQLFDATGLSALERTGEFMGDLSLYVRHIADTHTATLAVFFSFLVGILLWKRYVKFLPPVIPASVIGILFGWFEVTYMQLDLVSLGEKFGTLAGTLWQPVAWGSFIKLILSSEGITFLIQTGGVIALIAVLETLITAKIADKITHTQSSSKRELLGLGLANIGSGAMGGLPATGVFIRTGVNIKSGATHRTAAFIAALTTAAIALVVLPFFAFIPMAVIAAMLVNTAIGLIEVEKYKEFWRHEKKSFFLALLVAGITVLHDAGTAVLIGAGIALLLFADSVSRGRFDAYFNFEDGAMEVIRGGKNLHIPQQAKVVVATYSIAGFLGYIDSARHMNNLHHLARAQNVESVIIRLRSLFTLDHEGAEMLVEAIQELENHGKRVRISSANQTVANQLASIASTETLKNPQFLTRKTSEVLEDLRRARV